METSIKIHVIIKMLYCILEFNTFAYRLTGFSKFHLSWDIVMGVYAVTIKYVQGSSYFGQ